LLSITLTLRPPPERGSGRNCVRISHRRVRSLWCRVRISHRRVRTFGRTKEVVCAGAGTGGRELSNTSTRAADTMTQPADTVTQLADMVTQPADTVFWTRWLVVANIMLGVNGC